MTDFQRLMDLINEIVEDEPVSSDWDEGTCCVFCGRPWIQRLNSDPRPNIEHDSSCWIARARKEIS